MWDINSWIGLKSGDILRPCHTTHTDTYIFHVFNFGPFRGLSCKSQGLSDLRTFFGVVTRLECRIILCLYGTSSFSAEAADPWQVSSLFRHFKAKITSTLLPSRALGYMLVSVLEFWLFFLHYDENNLLKGTKMFLQLWSVFPRLLY